MFIFNRCVPLLVLLVAALPLNAGTVDEAARFHRAAVEAQNRGDYIEAEKYHRKTLEVIGTIPDFPPNERARQMSNLASTLTLTSKPAEALQLLLPAAEILVKHPSIDPGQYIALDLNIAKALSSLERYDEAEPYCLSALVRAEEAEAMDTMYGAEARSAHAYVQWKTGRIGDAIANYELAIAFWSAQLPGDHVLLENLRKELERASATK